MRNYKCKYCGGYEKHYDKVIRYVKIEYGKKKKVILNRNKCTNCGRIHRVLPYFIMPYKQYRKDIILSVINRTITSNTIGFEDYPCELTMIRWKKERAR